MFLRVRALSDDGLIEFTLLTSGKVEGALDIMRGSFFVHEKGCIGVELPQHPEAMIELEEVCRGVAKDGLSLIALEKSSRKVAGVAFIKLQVNGKQPNCYMQCIAKSKQLSSIVFAQFMNDAAASANLFELTRANCLLELMFLAVLPEYRNRGIGMTLFELFIELGMALKAGEDVKAAPEGKPLPFDLKPTAIFTVLTSTITQKFGEKKGFVKAAEISFEKFMFEGKSFASRIGPDTPFTMVEYKLL